MPPNILNKVGLFNELESILRTFPFLAKEKQWLIQGKNQSLFLFPRQKKSSRKWTTSKTTLKMTKMKMRTMILENSVK